MNNNLSDKSPKKSNPRWGRIILLVLFWWAAILVWLCMGIAENAKSSNARRKNKNNYGKYRANKTTRGY